MPRAELKITLRTPDGRQHTMTVENTVLDIATKANPILSEVIVDIVGAMARATVARIDAVPPATSRYKCEEVITDAGRRCRFCGCTQNHACVNDLGPCWWILPDVCSACAEKLPEGAVAA